MIFKKLWLSLLTAAALIVSQSSCSEDISDCPSKMCILAGGWKLTEVYLDDEKDNSDLTKYKLVLNTPNPTAATIADYTRIQPSGTSDNGMWSVMNNGKTLRLIPGNNTVLTEDWVIEKLTPRQMILVITRDTDIKQGPGKIRFILEPF
jgi:hypothetical protein